MNVDDDVDDLSSSSKLSSTTTSSVSTKLSIPTGIIKQINSSS